MAKKHAIVGWVKNTARGTVVGVAQGPITNIETMYVATIDTVGFHTVHLYNTLCLFVVGSIG